MTAIRERLHDLANYFGQDYIEGKELFDYLIRAGNLQDDLPNVIAFIGQSNCAAGPPAPIRGASPITQYLGSDILGFSETTKTFVQAVDGSANARTTIAVPTASTGPGVGAVGALLCRRIADRTKQPVHTYALAFTGQGIDYFLPSSGTPAFFDDGTQHASLNNYNLMKSYVALSGKIPQLCVWVQGEADAGASQAVYYTKLKTLFTALRTDYPGVRMLLVSSVGNKQDRNGAAAQPLTAVNDAKKQLAAENPGVVFYEDISDFAETAYMAPDDTHLATYCGYVELAERCFVTLTGEATRPAVSSAMHIRDAFPWTEFFYANKTISSGNVSQWQTDVPPNTTVMVPHANAPENIPFDASIGNMTCIGFDRDNSETLKKTGLTAANNWTLFAVMRADAAQPVQYLFEVQDAGSANRAAQGWFGQSLQVEFFYDAAGGTYDGGGLGYLSDSVAWHSFCWTLDTTNLVMKLYVDGVFYGQTTIDGSEVNMTEVWLASFFNTSHFEGRCAAFGYGRNLIATAQQVADMQGWVKEELKL